MLLYEIGSFDDIRFISFEFSTALHVSNFDFNEKNWFLFDKFPILRLMSQNKLFNEFFEFLILRRVCGP